MISDEIADEAVGAIWVFLDSSHIANLVGGSTLTVVEYLSRDLNILVTQNVLGGNVWDGVSVVSDSGSSWDERVEIGCEGSISESGSTVGIELEVVGTSLLDVNSNQFGDDSSKRVSGDDDGWVLGGVLGLEVLVSIQEGRLDVLVGLVEALVHTASSAPWVVDLVGLEVIIPVDNIAGASDSNKNIVVAGVVGSISLALMSYLIDNGDVLNSRELIAGSTTIPGLDIRLGAVRNLSVFKVKFSLVSVIGDTRDLDSEQCYQY